MAKSDFDIDDQEYDVVYEESSKKHPFSGLKKKSKDKENKESDFSSDSSDLGDFSGDSNITDFVKDPSSLIDTIKNINIRTLIVVLGVILVLSVIIFMVVLTSVKSEKHYSAEIIIPDVLYVGETSAISVVSKYDGETTPKKDISSTVSTFETSDKNIIYSVNDDAIGSNITSVIIPVQPGKATLKASAKLDGKTLASEEKEVLVCPEFKSNLLSAKTIYIEKDSSYGLNIPMDDECFKDIKYSSSNPGVAIVSENGSILGKAIGKSVVTIKKDNRTINVNVNVVEEEVALEAVKSSVSELQLSLGEQYKLNVSYLPVEATNISIRFGSSNETIVSVDSNGIVTAKKVGTATIKALNVPYGSSPEITVTVTEKNEPGVFATQLNLFNSSLNMFQGESKKLKAVLKPSNINSEILKWKSSDENIVYVTNDGLIYAKNVGDATITAYTDNGLSKDVTVKVNMMTAPVITPSDGISSGKWHTKSYILNFSGSTNGAVYYYNAADKNGYNSDKLIVGVDKASTYSLRYCTRVCSKVCKNADSKDCSLKCAEAPYVCSAFTTYDSKLDTTKPYVSSAEPVQNSLDSLHVVQISFEDATSGVSKWCVTDKDSFAYCKWKSVKVSTSVNIPYASHKKGIYYAFAKDVAGNISEGYKFEIE